MAVITKWEYRQEIYQGPEALNLMGIDGWELVCAVGSGGSFLIFKRPIVGKQSPAQMHAEALAASSIGGSSPGSSSGAPGSMAPKKKFKEMI